MTSQGLCILIGAGHHQQCGGKLCLSVRAPVAERLEKHHRHRPEWDGLRHPGAGQEADPESERSEVTERKTQRGHRVVKGHPEAERSEVTESKTQRSEVTERSEVTKSKKLAKV